jgi:putative sugar O-methyltransferase
MKHLFKKIIQKIHPSIPCKVSTSLSDNQIYPNFCLQASSHYEYFMNFRRNPVYNKILEHVSCEQGQEYLNEIKKTPDILNKFEIYKKNDEIGNPITCEYPEFGNISPTTLRYVKVLCDLKNIFDTLDNLNICEIGVGYGGQCRIINSFFTPSSYRLVDIKPALMLAQKFLDNFIIPSTLSYKTMNELAPKKYDLIISNYSFTELPRAFQDAYLNKVILNSKRGYIDYNEITPPEFKSYKKNDLLKIIPGARIIDKTPCFDHDNCIIAWG